MSHRIGGRGMWRCLAGLLSTTLVASSAVAERRVWWVVQDGALVTQTGFFRANVTGTNVTDGHGYGNGTITGVAVYGEDVYESVVNSTNGSIRKNGSIISNSTTIKPKYLVHHRLTGQLYFFDDTGNDIYRIQPDGTGLTMIYANAGLAVNSVAIDPGSDYLFWSDTDGVGSIHRISLPNGTGHISVAASNPLVALDDIINILLVRNLFGGIDAKTYTFTHAGQMFPNGTDPSYMAVEPSGNYVYWSHAATGTIKRAQGSSIATILSPDPILAGAPIFVEWGPYSCARTVPYGDQDASGNITVIDVGKVVDAVKDVPTVHEDDYNIADVFPCTGSGASKACIGDGFVNVQDIGRIVDMLKGISFTCP